MTDKFMNGIMRCLSASGLLLLALVGLYGCEPDARLTGVAAGARGLYVVTAYIVGGDTLFSIAPGSTGYIPEINKIDVNNFTVELNTVDSDRLMMRATYWRNGQRSTFAKEVTVRLSSYNYEFSLVDANAASAYEGNVGRFSGLFYERTAGGGLLIPPASSASQDVIIVGQPAK